MDTIASELIIKSDDECELFCHNETGIEIKDDVVSELIKQTEIEIDSNCTKMNEFDSIFIDSIASSSDSSNSQKRKQEFDENLVKKSKVSEMILEVSDADLMILRDVYNDIESEMLLPENLQSDMIITENVSEPLKLNNSMFNNVFKEPVMLECSYCPLLFLDNLTLGTHTKDVHNIIEIKCNLCNANVENETMLTTHMANDHHVERIQVFDCLSCNFYFYDQLDFEDHIKTCNNSVPVSSEKDGKVFKNSKDKYNKITCNICNLQSVMTESAFRLHQQKHKNQLKLTKIPCLYCNKVCFDCNVLEKHVRSFHITCKVCNIYFDSIQDLTLHEMEHERDNITFFCCCAIEFKTASEYKSHCTSVHAGRHNSKSIYRKVKNIKYDIGNFDARPQCVYCNNIFATNEELMSHLQFIHDIKDCTYCKKELGKMVDSGSACSICANINNINLDECNKEAVRHVAMDPLGKLPRQKIHKCSTCAVEYVNIHNLIKHYKEKHHANTSNCVCLYCSSILSDVALLETHLKLKHNACKVCDIVFMNREMLNVHENYHKEGVINFYVCACGNEFKNQAAFNHHKKTCLPYEPSSDIFPIKRKMTETQFKQHDDSFACHYCHVLFTEEQSLVFHKKNKHKLEFCQVCDLQVILAHNSMSLEEMNCICSKCKTSQTIVELQLETAAATRDKTDDRGIKSPEVVKIQSGNVKETVSNFLFQCNACNIGYDEIDSFDQHFRDCHQIKSDDISNGENILLQKCLTCPVYLSLTPDHQAVANLKCYACSGSKPNKTSVNTLTSIAPPSTDVLHINLHLQSDSIEKSHDELPSEIHCPICKNILANTKDLVSHCKICTKVIINSVPCSQCDEEFKNTCSLKLHVYTVHKLVGGKRIKRNPEITWKGGKYYKCSICLAMFDNATKFFAHNSPYTNHTSLLFHCIPCDFTCSDTIDYKSHCSLKHDSQSFQCKICREKYNNVESLKKHVTSSHFIDVVFCTNCMTNVPVKYYFNYHLRKCTYKRTTCLFCACNVFALTNPRIHVETHANDSFNNIYCDICLCYFQNQHNYNLHYALVHRDRIDACK